MIVAILHVARKPACLQYVRYATWRQLMYSLCPRIGTVCLTDSAKESARAITRAAKLKRKKGAKFADYKITALKQNV